MVDRLRGLYPAVDHAERFLRGLDERPVDAAVDARVIREALGGPLPDQGQSPEAVIESLAVGADPGIVASADLATSAS